MEGVGGWPSFDASLNALGIFFACRWLWITASPFRLLSADLFLLLVCRRDGWHFTNLRRLPRFEGS